MKKFSKVKYFGAVAAALLAVAPIAAPVVSQVASPAIAQAATDTAVQQKLDAAVKSTVNTNQAVSSTEKSTVTGINKAGQTFTSGFGSEFGKKLLVDPDDVSNTATKFDGYFFTVTINGTGNATDGTLANLLRYNGAKMYTVQINVYNSLAATEPVAAKTVTVNVANYFAAKISGASVEQGTSTDTYKGVGSIAGALTLTDGDNKSVPVSAGDFSHNTAIRGYDQDVAVATDNTNASGTFTSAGTYYGVYKLTASASQAVKNTLYTVAANNGYNKVTNTSFDGSTTVQAISDNGGVYVADSSSIYIVRPIQVTTGENDKAYNPVVKFTTGTDSSSSNSTTTTYYDGDTIDTKLNFIAGSTATDGASYSNMAAALLKLYGVDGSDVNPASGKFKGYENSIKGGGLTTNLGLDSRYTVNGYKYNSESNLETVLKSLVPNNGKSQTVKVPLKVTNTRGNVSTINLQFTIGTNVGTPIATEFSGYTEITKGQSFDPLKNIQFQNSSLDNGVIPASRINYTSNVDTTTPGTYTVTYTVTNAVGKTATFTRTVVVTAGDLTESNQDGVVYINKADGAVIYSDSATTKATDKTLDNTTAWKFHSVVKDANGKIVAYNLGGKQYVKAGEVSTSPVKAQAGVFTVNYPANSKWSIAVYNSDLKVVKLIPAKSSWLTFGTKTLKDGKSYYNLGGNQWVRTDYGFWNAK